MARKIDYDALCENISRLMVEHLKEDTIPVPVETAMDICFAVARIRQIEWDLQGKFQEIP